MKFSYHIAGLNTHEYGLQVKDQSMRQEVREPEPRQNQTALRRQE